MTEASQQGPHAERSKGRVQTTERLIEIRAVPVETESWPPAGMKSVPSVGNRNSLRCLTVVVGRVIVSGAGSDADVLDGVVEGPCACAFAASRVAASKKQRI